MKMPSQQETLLFLQVASEAAVKKEKLLAANKAAARALLSAIPTVSYTTKVTKRSDESAE